MNGPPIDDDPRRGAERPSHPRMAAALLMVGVVVLLLLISVAPLL